MAVRQNLYHIIKLPASMIAAAEGLDVGQYTLDRALRDDNVVAIGDNIVFRLLRRAKGDERDPSETFDYIQSVRARERALRKRGKHAEAAALERHATNVLFVPEVVNVLVDAKKSDFKRFAIKGFSLNGAHYVYLCSGSGQIRRNTATFVDERYRDALCEAINCGLLEKTKQFSAAKYTAYFALAFSSVLWVRTPRVCVIRDYFRTLKDTPVDFIIPSPNEGEESRIERRAMDLELNCADGQGLIDPEFAALWAEDMGLDYTPCSFVARSCFVKGNLVPFDFKAYAAERGISTIRDCWGIEHDLSQIDVLLSESQFKTHKYYSSWEEYSAYAERGGIPWGVARYPRREDDEWVQANYQYIQALSLSQPDVEGLIAPTVSWLRAICSGEPLPTLLYLFGQKGERSDFRSIFGAAQTAPMKAVAKDARFLSDPYVQSRVRKSIAAAIDRAKIGKVWIRGNYQFMISDPVAQCQSALGLDPVGCLGPDEVYSRFWLSRGVAEVDCCRSPMIDCHEHNPMSVSASPEAERWLSGIYSGIVYNTYDTSCFRHEDSDFDGDIVLTTDNPYFIKGSHKDHPIITYDKGSYPPSDLTLKNIISAVCKGFGSGVGGFSNTATILYSMQALFDRPGHEDQRDEIARRIKLLREIVGQEIDRIKGADKPSLPSAWRKVESPAPGAAPEERSAIARRNAMAITKKPYFFRYLYPELNQRLKRYEQSYDAVCRDSFGTKLKRLLRRGPRTDAERELVSRYRRFCPLITAPCAMNRLCRAFEAADLDIRLGERDPATGKRLPGTGPAKGSLLPSYASRWAAKDDPARRAVALEAYREWHSRRGAKAALSVLGPESPFRDDDEYAEARAASLDASLEKARSILSAAGMEGDELLWHCRRLSESMPSFDWAFPWEALGDSIVPLIPVGRTLAPVPDPEGEEYLGRRFRLADATDPSEAAIERMMSAIFGDPRAGEPEWEYPPAAPAHEFAPRIRPEGWVPPEIQDQDQDQDQEKGDKSHGDEAAEAAEDD